MLNTPTISWALSFMSLTVAAVIDARALMLDQYFQFSAPLPSFLFNFLVEFFVIKPTQQPEIIVFVIIAFVFLLISRHKIPRSTAPASPWVRIIDACYMVIGYAVSIAFGLSAIISSWLLLWAIPAIGIWALGSVFWAPFRVRRFINQADTKKHWDLLLLGALLGPPVLFILAALLSPMP